MANRENELTKNTDLAFYPILFKPVLKDYIWGGRNLEKLGTHFAP